MTFLVRSFIFVVSSIVATILHAQTLDQCFAPYDRAEYRSAFECFSKFAAQGNSVAQFFLGEMSLAGRGYPRMNSLR